MKPSVGAQRPPTGGGAAIRSPAENTLTTSGVWGCGYGLRAFPAGAAVAWVWAGMVRLVSQERIRDAARDRLARRQPQPFQGRLWVHGAQAEGVPASTVLFARRCAWPAHFAALPRPAVEDHVPKTRSGGVRWGSPGLRHSPVRQRGGRCGIGCLDAEGAPEIGVLISEVSQAHRDHLSGRRNPPPAQPERRPAIAGSPCQQPTRLAGQPTRHRR